MGGQVVGCRGAVVDLLALGVLARSQQRNGRPQARCCAGAAAARLGEAAVRGLGTLDEAGGRGGVARGPCRSRGADAGEQRCNAASAAR